MQYYKMFTRKFNIEMEIQVLFGKKKDGRGEINKSEKIERVWDHRCK